MRTFFVSYSFCRKNGSFGFGNCSFKCDRLMSIDVLRAFERKTLQDNPDFQEVAILYYAELEQ